MKGRLRHRFLFSASVCCLLAASGCGDGTVFHQYRPTPLKGWDKQDTLYFELPPMPATQTCHLTLEFRTTCAFPYQNLWLVVEQRLHDPKRLRRDTIEYVLTGPQGTDKEKGVNLTSHERDLPPEKFIGGQHGQICVYHIMRRETVPGICDVGLRLSTDNRH